MSENLLFGLMFVLVIVFVAGVTTIGRRHRTRRRAR